MTNLINRIDRTLKTKEDLQSFVLVALVLFVLLVKCYMMVNPTAVNATDSQINAEVVKSHTNSNS